MENSNTKRLNVNIDFKDANNTTPSDHTKDNFFDGFTKFGSNMLRTVYTSKMFWILLVGLPMIFTLLEYILYCQTVTLELAGEKGGMIDSVKFTYDFINWSVMSPMVLLSLIIFPTFISQSRENNTLKRMNLIGVSRSQFYYYYMLFTLAVFLVFVIFWLGPWLWMMDIAVFKLFKNSDAINSMLQTEGYGVYSFLGGAKMFRFAVIAIIASLTLNSLGYKKAMSVKSSSNLLGWGIGLWIFSMMTSGFSVLLSFQILGYEISNSFIANIVLTILLLGMKWVFLATIPTMFSYIMVMSLQDMHKVLSDNFAKPWTSDAPANFISREYYLTMMWIITIAIIAFGIYIMVTTWLKRTSIISFEASR